MKYNSYVCSRISTTWKNIKFTFHTNFVALRKNKSVSKKINSWTKDLISWKFLRYKFANSSKIFLEPRTCHNVGLRIGLSAQTRNSLSGFWIKFSEMRYILQSKNKEKNKRQLQLQRIWYFDSRNELISLRNLILRIWTNSNSWLTNDAFLNEKIHFFTQLWHCSIIRADVFKSEPLSQLKKAFLTQEFFLRSRTGFWHKLNFQCQNFFLSETAV